MLPRYFQLFTLSAVNKSILKTVDIKIKSAVRQILKLPHYSPDGFFFASVKDGGLGLRSACTSVPFHAYNRITYLDKSLSLPARALYKTAEVKDFLQKYISLLDGVETSDSGVLAELTLF